MTFERAALAAVMEVAVERGLVERAQHGDRAAFTELAYDVSDRLYGVALRILRDADAAGDVLQQSLVSIWRDLPDLRDPESFEGWSYRVVVHHCHSHLRRTRRLPATVELLPSAATVSDVQISVSLRDELQRAFSRLTTDQRAVVVLTYYQDMSVSEVARALGISFGTVKSRLHAARRAMRAAVEADARLGGVGEGRPA
jgi:RNA polymerase sigma-70 factor (ECF subfamily)